MKTARKQGKQLGPSRQVKLEHSHLECAAHAQQVLLELWDFVVQEQRAILRHGELALRRHHDLFLRERVS